MPSAHLVKKAIIKRTPRVMQMEGIFDLPRAEESVSTWDVNFELPPEWNIGLIVGPSGSGKTIISRECFGEFMAASFSWPTDQSILDGFPKGLGIKEIVQLLSSVGFSSPPAWVRPFHLLSNGEQFRVNVARALAEKNECCLIDEFTSVVDRRVAQIGSAAVAKAVRRMKRRFIAVSCHYDIAEWLAPDWIYEPHLNKFALPRGAIQRPAIELNVARVDKAAWQLFEPHHYLTSHLHKAAKCYVASFKGAPAAFCAVLHFPHPIRPGYREHRTVCLPDFQGVGIGSALSDFLAACFVCTGKPYRDNASHPAHLWHRARSGLWRINPPHLGTASSSRTMGYLNNTIARDRLTTSFEYIGPKNFEAAKQLQII